MNQLEARIVATKLRIAAECLKIAAGAIEQGDIISTHRELAETNMHLNDATVVLEMVAR